MREFEKGASEVFFLLKRKYRNLWRGFFGKFEKKVWEQKATDWKKGSWTKLREKNRGDELGSEGHMYDFYKLLGSFIFIQLQHVFCVYWYSILMSVIEPEFVCLHFMLDS